MVELPSILVIPEVIQCHSHIVLMRPANLPSIWCLESVHLQKSCAAAAQACVDETPATLATMSTRTRLGNTSISKSAASTTATDPPPPKRKRVEGTVSLDFLLKVVCM